MNLSLRGDSVYGTVTVNGRDLDWAAVAAGDITRMSVSEQRKAIEAVRMASVNLGRYGKFALPGRDAADRKRLGTMCLTFSSTLCPAPSQGRNSRNTTPSTVPTKPRR